MIITVPLLMIDLHDDGYHPILELTIFDQNFKVVLDTGASRTAFDRQMMALANENLSLMATERTSTGLGTTDMASYTTVIPSMSIGELHLQDVEVAVLDLSTINYAYGQLNHPQVLGVLGGDILMKYKSVIDYGSKKLKFKV